VALKIKSLILLLVIALLIIPTSLYATPAESQTEVVDLTNKFKKQDDPASQETKTKEMHPIDKFLEKCISDNSTTDGMNRCTGEATTMWDEEMNKNYNLLMGILDNKEKQQLRDAQVAWINYRDSETDFRMDTLLGLKGAMYSNMATAEKMDIVKRRAFELKQFYETLKFVDGERLE